MKNLSIFFFTLILLASACKKEETTTPAETPLASFFADSTVKFGAKTINSTYYEYGQRFQVSKAGKITRLGVKTPTPGSYRVVIWDVATKSIVSQKTLEVTIANDQAWGDITPLALTANKQYYITYLSNNWNIVYPKTGSNFSFPIVKGNVVFLAYGYISSALGAAPKYPTTEPTNYMAGFVDFTFLPD
ncbi:uncharacterized protein DUF4082 [Arcicella aurantiaca]|uniref:Uncharacterized protein DUF4082 n=1 Tax=Arcicella aurantiaca TaxID=591202 RepID=A0A316EEY8_9BACT|nr:DUF4082 domain-containing protein [Arcicella aurantiaca]PWK28640.1 uncharacterized protein DUF4082 [Arcicella aurantiaca]